MMSTMSRRWIVRCVVALAVVPPVVASCAQSDFTKLQADGGGSEAGADTLVEEEEDIELPCDPEEGPQDGVFVSAAVGVESGNGSVDAPVRTLAAAMMLAAARGVDVYVDEGTYPEALVFDASFAGLAVRGGWKAGTPWKRDCEGDFRTRTILASPEPVGVRVRTEAPAARITLEALTIATSAPEPSAEDAPGVSTYGLFVEGSSLVRLDKVRVIAGRAGDAGKAPATPNSGALACDGYVCSLGKGGENAPSAGAGASEPGGFSETGYEPGHGEDGSDGEAGQNGTAGEDKTFTCYNGTCHGQCNSTDVIADQCTVCDRQDQRSRATCGCGGAPGGKGRGGRGGGAAIGVFVAGGAVAANHTRLVMTGGGAGASGGAGGAGGAGGGGNPGAAVTCHGQNAVANGPLGKGCGCRPEVTTSPSRAAAGGRGGQGGSGSAGGGGAGGSVYGVVTLGDAQFTKDDASRFSLGDPGAGAGGAANGAQGEQLRVPVPVLPDADVP